MKSIDEKILILGATGLLGHVLLKTLHNFGFNAIGTCRNERDLQLFSSNVRRHLIHARNLLDRQELVHVLSEHKPTVVINCLSINSPLSQDLEPLLKLYALFPKMLFNLCKSINARYIHISSD